MPQMQWVGANGELDQVPTPRTGRRAHITDRSVDVRSAFVLSRGIPVARCFNGQRLRDARIAARLRPEQLAHLVGRSVFTVHAYERGDVHPPINVLAQVADVLGRPLDDFLAEEVVAYAG